MPTLPRPGSKALSGWLVEAKSFGVRFVFTHRASGLEARGKERVIALTDGSEVTARAVIVAAGVAYRRIGVPSLERLVGVGVFYGAAGVEAPAMAGEEAYVVGGRTPQGRPPCTWPGSVPTSPCLCGASRLMPACPTT